MHRASADGTEPADSRFATRQRGERYRSCRGGGGGGRAGSREAVQDPGQGPVSPPDFGRKKKGRLPPAEESRPETKTNPYQKTRRATNCIIRVRFAVAVIVPKAELLTVLLGAAKTG